ncbi:hypothetical protein EJ05DRAFT_487132 [Pseudovirgaria hyperparasitica]|uniref:Uncharacterized protein n=1 Tax=Pseudovirgaria hyperparasitica TaxID=470096 RepID=A0A6A6W7V7_9PEZI|nr:uncharacterized protein EJ05DRAFT_487132 [Pseudovirgaria hyperparasitica]KAF2757161.1 hypothetical protein EJ05DRAFT_487132 [Pseudovirgaria hyperparasitica]
MLMLVPTGAGPWNGGVEVVSLEAVFKLIRVFFRRAVLKAVCICVCIRVCIARLRQICASSSQYSLFLSVLPLSRKLSIKTGPRRVGAVVLVRLKPLCLKGENEHGWCRSSAFSLSRCYDDEYRVYRNIVQCTQWASVRFVRHDESAGGLGSM